MTNTGINLKGVRKHERPKGVILGMFKMDCLALFGRNVLHSLDVGTIDNILRKAYSGLLKQVTQEEMKQSYGLQQRPAPLHSRGAAHATFHSTTNTDFSRDNRDLASVDNHQEDD